MNGMNDTKIYENDTILETSTMEGTDPGAPVWKAIQTAPTITTTVTPTTWHKKMIFPSREISVITNTSDKNVNRRHSRSLSTPKRGYDVATNPSYGSRIRLSGASEGGLTGTFGPDDQWRNRAGDDQRSVARCNKHFKRLFGVCFMNHSGHMSSSKRVGGSKVISDGDHPAEKNMTSIFLIEINFSMLNNNNINMWTVFPFYTLCAHPPDNHRRGDLPEHRCYIQVGR
ncbi:hypothetical protein T11_18375 [Trichinella zimbabwensis]|uniref:Uncharacterized protein n=1 Tax=Trichinella zimbabwensis TaxID=268475 RepID=A0A0V1GX86_9BILA|nr:hypothetical protein T11_14978 [Trichinella zimbabwensis]KRZ01391.1 hypothetical protein T11_9953 [Trichinella zimbabwensis]KRZ02758.1 hypothetical protein T11_18375 [Trichinella zimbabwensis]